MTRMLVLFTGGTIGSSRSELEIDVNESGSMSLLDDYRALPRSRSDVELEALQPLNVLSENITPTDWLALAAAVQRADWPRYDAVIVAHGSDTLAYTAALMSYLFSHMPIPLILTASNYPKADPRSNGLRNLAAAIDFAADAALPGVYAVYENENGEPIVYLGTRLLQCESFTDQFRSPYGVPYGKMSDRRFVWERNSGNPTPEQMRLNRRTPRWPLSEVRLDDRIVYIRPYPGLNYSQYSFADVKPRAIVHDLHHSGTANALDYGPYSLLAFIERCSEAGIPCYLCPIKDASGAMYASSRKLAAAGGIFIENMSVEATLTKLMLAYGVYGAQGDRRVQSFLLDENVFYERMTKSLQN